MDIQSNKNNFLKKKKQQKKIKQQQAQKNKAYNLLSKNVKAFLIRSQIIKNNNENLKLLLFMKKTHFVENVNGFQQLINCILDSQEKQTVQWFYFKTLVYCSFKDHRLLRMLPKIFRKKPQFQNKITQQQQFLKNLDTILSQNSKGSEILSQILESLEFNQLKKISNKTIWSLVNNQFHPNHLQIQQSTEADSDLPLKKIILLLNHLYLEKFIPQEKNNFQSVLKIVMSLLSFISIQKIYQQQQNALCFCIKVIDFQIKKQNQKLLQKLTQQNKHLIDLIDDQQSAQYIQNKIRQDQKFQEYTNYSIQILQKIFKNEKMAILFKKQKADEIRNIIIQMVKCLNNIFDSNRLLFFKEILSSDQTLQTLVLQSPKQPLFYESLKIKILTMDDEQFIKSKLFTDNQWKSVIKDGITSAFEATKKNLILSQSKIQQFSKVKLFAPKNQDIMLVKTISDLLGNLYKKILRTKLIPATSFIIQELDNLFYTFNFGTGAKALQIMLKNFPFAFNFETRLQKMTKFIKQDKKNHDRTLFLQDQIDQDLIIEVRRNHEFMDAYQSCMTRDLRKKYKIVFFNEQGLQQQGIDGGGIIKEFINRVLKSGFSQAYDLFYETPKNQLIPNPLSLKTGQYEFLGKIVGKAVYQGITIQPKFAQPFLNLLIGRQNSFEDLQFLDQKIYKSLLQIKHMGKQIDQMQQTFNIMDFLPNGKTKYVNLLNPDKPSFKEVYVTQENKLNFIMAYADYKCNRQLRQKTWHFRKGFLKVMKPEWLTMFNNQQVNLIISGSKIDFSVKQLKAFTVYNDYLQKDKTIQLFWQVLQEFTAEQKGLFLHYVTSCSRPPTLGFSQLKPNFCIGKLGDDVNKLPTAITCMNILRLPTYKTKQQLKEKLKYAINAKAGFQFA